MCRAVRGIGVGVPCEAKALAEPTALRFLLVGDERDDRAIRPRTPGSSGAVKVCGPVLWRVEMDHTADVFDVDAAGCDVGPDENLHGACMKSSKGPVTLGLGSVAVDRRRGDPRREELSGEPVRAVLGPAEHDRRGMLGDDPRGGRRTGAVIDAHEAVRARTDVVARSIEDVTLR